MHNRAQDLLNNNLAFTKPDYDALLCYNSLKYMIFLRYRALLKVRLESENISRFASKPYVSAIYLGTHGRKP